MSRSGEFHASRQDREPRVLDDAGERPLDMEGKRVGSVKVQHIKRGMLVRPPWGDFPFREVTGEVRADVNHPGHDPEDRSTHMYPIPYRRTFSPHQAHDTSFDVIVDAAQSPPARSRGPRRSLRRQP